MGMEKRTLLQPMNPVMPEVSNDEVTQDAERKRHGKNHFRQMRADFDPAINTAGERENNEKVEDCDSQILQHHFAVGHCPGRADQFDRGNADESRHKQQREKQIIVEEIGTCG